MRCPRNGGRRRFLGSLLIGVYAGLGPGSGYAAEAGKVLVLSRKRLLNEVQAAIDLAAAEQRETARLQAQVDVTKNKLNDEEKALSEMRTTILKEEFDRRVSEFDRKVRQARRETQTRVTALQQAFQNARQEIFDALPAVIEELRVEHQAQIVMTAEQVIALSPDVDITNEAIARFNARFQPKAFPTLESALRDMTGAPASGAILNAPPEQ